MNLIDKIAELKKEHEESRADIWNVGKKTLSEGSLYDAAPIMLAALGQIRPGDAAILEKLADQLEDFEKEFPGEVSGFLDCLRRLQAMCKLMEEEHD